ncbi:malate-aspartate shuttle [Aureococcus anophagefferens]|nr:malate-aspartate shuttle [Aureococcus anophagefferens]
MDSLLAGSVAGIVADIITHPIGTIKTRLQVQGASAGSSSLAQYGSIGDAASRILRAEGVGALYRGVGIVVATAAPAQGLFFLCGSLLWVPMDTIKERMQVEGQMAAGSREALGSSSAAAVSAVFRLEGPRGFYPAYWIHQWTWAPFNGLYFAIYEAAKEAADARGLPAWPCGVVAGVVAGAATNPADLVKTRLQVARADPKTFQYAGAVDCAAQIVRREGPAALFDGAVARCATVTPLTICVLVRRRHAPRRAPRPPD